MTSPQAFDGLRLAGRTVRRPDRTLATADHNVPTDDTPVARMIADELSRKQVEALEANCEEFGVPLYSLGSDRRGIVHVIGPELGITQPGMTIVCGDSHTATHGAFGALAFGIGTSEVEHVLATQTLVQRRAEDDARSTTRGELADGVGAKDMILATIGRLGTGGMAGYVVEYAGETVRGLSMEGRMTMCNMTIEGGGRAGMIAPDETTFDYVRGPARRPGRLRRGRRPTGASSRTDDGAEFDTEVEIDASSLSPMVTWGTNPGMVTEVAAHGARPGRRSTAPSTPRRPSGRSPTWRSSRGRRSPRSSSTASSSAPARTRGSRTSGPRLRWSPAARSPRRSGRWSCRAPSRSAGRPRRRACTRSSATPASSGAPPAARCAWG